MSTRTGVDATKLERLLAPRSVAVVGASERPDSYGSNVLENLARAGFEGDVWGVNPNRDEVHGRPCVASVSELPGPVDAVVVAVPAPGVPAALREAGALGCGGAVVLSAGFGEVAGGVELERELAAVAAEHELPVCGPNGNGVCALAARAPLWGDGVSASVRRGAVAMVSQSGNVAVNALNSRRGIGFHTVVSVGNSTVLDPADWLAALAERHGVRSVAMFCEDEGDGERFALALARCSELGVGVAVLKGGSSAAGAAAAAAHTGAIAGDARVFRSLVEEAGGAWATDPHELLELARVLAMPLSRPSGRGGLAILTCSGGDSSLAADAADARGIDLPALAPGTMARLAELLPEAATPGNPLDYTSVIWGQTERLEAIARTVGDDAAIDQLLLFFDDSPGLEPHARDEWKATRDALVAGAEASAAAPLLASTLPDLIDVPAVVELTERGVPTVAGMGAALRAASALRVPLGDPERLRAVAAATRGGSEPLGPAMPRWRSEAEVKRILGRSGISVPRGQTATSADEAMEIAERIGYPVALKLSAPGLLHKTELDAVELWLSDHDALRAAASRLLAIGHPGAELLVESMAGPGVDVVVAAHTDGVVPVLAIGLGGIWTEVLDDVVIVPLPASPTRVLRAIGTLRAAPVLTGARGGPRLALAALADLASAAGDLLLSERLELLELNPVRVDGAGAVALDAVARG
ncbi:acetate--CoA ligase family protein [Thermoleophilia bacterium SCSIO 60948]|nr:acetate--CoA ligase family protein [Thermoleophilia bacterium SCSIO 60948]